MKLAHGRRDGSKPKQPAPEGWERLERDEFIRERGYSQVLAHKAMAAKPARVDPTYDAHPDTIKARAAMYAKLAQEEQGL